MMKQIDNKFRKYVKEKIFSTECYDFKIVTFKTMTESDMYVRRFFSMFTSKYFIPTQYCFNVSIVARRLRSKNDIRNIEDISHKIRSLLRYFYKETIVDEIEISIDNLMEMEKLFFKFSRIKGILVHINKEIHLWPFT